ncbi:class I adenylate-forming enzyme family protein [Streptomyces sp. NPDC058623]|uniref:class I adenylate-forming enzyme family protein n=1 Tax=Streptomyces sp. NPDC058623 TaxID=3346563 RepID=UPI003668E52E
MLLQRVRNRGIGLGTLLERAAALHPANVMIFDHPLDVAPELGTRVTVAEVADLVDDLAARLWAAKVRPGEHVVIHKSDGFDITLLGFAVARVGAVPVMLSPKLPGPVVAELIRRNGRPVLITDEAKLTGELPRGTAEACEQVLLASGSGAGATPLSQYAGASRIPPVGVPSSGPALITHTSGTTGVPKLAVHTGESLEARYRPQAAAVTPLLRRRPETVAMHVSFVHSRIFLALAVTLLRGCPVVVLADPDPERAAELFARLRPGILEAHPNTFMEWEPLAKDPREPLANVKLFSSTFDAIHPRTVKLMLHASRRRSAIFGQLYGQSEVGPVTVRTFTRQRLFEADGRCVGFPFPGMTGIRVTSRNGRTPSRENPGHIEVRSDGRVRTYLDEHERYEGQVTEGGWWRMGDVGYRSRYGCVHLLDREVDLIEGFGSTLAAEDTLLDRMGDLTEVIVVPGADGTAVPVVCTRGDLPLDRAAWQHAVRGLPPMADPVQWKLEELPHTATTKIKRRELTRVLGERAARATR